MIEIPRAALVADEIAKTAQFFSFGTNDLTQTTMGMSRDDLEVSSKLHGVGSILANPFASVDQSGVGQLMEIAVKKGKSSRRGIKLGICGEHGGDPSSVMFCHRIGLNYVSCSPSSAYSTLTAQAAVSTVSLLLKTLLHLGSGCYAIGPYFLKKENLLFMFEVKEKPRLVEGFLISAFIRKESVRMQIPFDELDELIKILESV